MVVEEAQPSICTERTTMIIIGIVLSFVGLAYLCWLLFALAVHALPFFAGVTVGLAAYHSGSGPVAAIITGAIAGGIILALGQVAFTRLRSPVMRAALALLFVVPGRRGRVLCGSRARAARRASGGLARRNRNCGRDHRGGDGLHSHVALSPA